MEKRDHKGEMERWALILAGGDGTRLKPLTRAIAGDDRPKQFCSMFGGRTLLDDALRRASSLVPEDRTIAVVTRAHESYYRQLSDSNLRSGLLAQPQNKGTAAAIILGLLRIA